MGGGAGAADGEEARFGLGGRHTRQGAGLGVGELAAGDRRGEQGEAPEGAGDADALAGGAGVEADAPGEPVGAGAEAGVPAAAGVELAYEVEEAGG
ncbi:MAG: hypothetical protein A2X52_07370 [Candidatus Rokubacteria bacterium GWC2_70_16]|nr:MAG: hypothetical protein A2X52_07370 [Candidatus Rokubacteria bacterium GWC2_70_16]